MNRFHGSFLLSTCLLASFLLGTPASAQWMGWTLSASDTDPFENTGVPGAPGTLTTLYVWYACNTPPPGVPPSPLALIAMFASLDPWPSELVYADGFYGPTPPSTGHLWLITDECPLPPVRAAAITYVNTGEGLDVRITADGPYYWAEDCEQQNWPLRSIGYSEVGPPFQDFVGPFCESPVSVESDTWGGVKELYR